MKPFVITGLLAGLLSGASPAAAQDSLIARVLVDVCLPYANRSQSFEKSIKAAREMGFRRPVGDNAPLEEWASEIDMVSHDGIWRLRLGEGSVEEGDASVYAVACTLSSRRESARELVDFSNRAFDDDRYWSRPPGNPWRWDRRTARPDEYALAVDVTEAAGERPRLTVRGRYY